MTAYFNRLLAATNRFDLLTSADSSQDIEQTEQIKDHVLAFLSSTFNLEGAKHWQFPTSKDYRLKVNSLDSYTYTIFLSGKFGLAKKGFAIMSDVREKMLKETLILELSTKFPDCIFEIEIQANLKF